MRDRPTAANGIDRGKPGPGDASPGSEAPPAPPPPIHLVQPEAVYGLLTAQTALGLKRGTLPREIRLGRLRVSKRGGRYLILGKWLLEWIEGGELKRRTRHEPAGN